LELMLKGRRVTEDQALVMMELKNTYYLELVSKMTPADLLPGARAILVELGQLNILRVIVSASKNAPLVIERLKIGDLIDGIIDGSAPARSKPAPDLFLLAAEKYAVPPAECLVIEDAAAGIEAAHLAGMPAVGLGPAARVGAAELVLPSLEGQQASEILRKLRQDPR